MSRAGRQLAWITVAALGTGAVAAEPVTWRITGLSGAETLNVRAGPSTAYDIVAEIAPGALLRGLGCEGVGAARWCRIEMLGGTATGWVSARFLTPADGRTGSTAAASDAAAVKPPPVAGGLPGPMRQDDGGR